MRSICTETSLAGSSQLSTLLLDTGAANRFTNTLLFSTALFSQLYLTANQKSACSVLPLAAETNHGRIWSPAHIPRTGGAEEPAKFVCNCQSSSGNIPNQLPSPSQLDDEVHHLFDRLLRWYQLHSYVTTPCRCSRRLFVQRNAGRIIQTMRPALMNNNNPPPPSVVGMSKEFPLRRFAPTKLNGSRYHKKITPPFEAVVFQTFTRTPVQCSAYVPIPNSDRSSTHLLTSLSSL